MIPRNDDDVVGDFILPKNGLPKSKKATNPWIGGLSFGLD
jgi:hypothetical protein